jgi:hypothetical protein
VDRGSAALHGDGCGRSKITGEAFLELRHERPGGGDIGGVDALKQHFFFPFAEVRRVKQ